MGFSILRKYGQIKETSLKYTIFLSKIKLHLGLQPSYFSQNGKAHFSLPKALIDTMNHVLVPIKDLSSCK
jgi:hypothetical protein